MTSIDVNFIFSIHNYRKFPKNCRNNHRSQLVYKSFAIWSCPALSRSSACTVFFDCMTCSNNIFLRENSSCFSQLKRFVYGCNGFAFQFVKRHFRWYNGTFLDRKVVFTSISELKCNSRSTSERRSFVRSFVRAKRVDSSRKTFPRNRRTKLVLAPSSRRGEADLAAFLSTQQPFDAHISSRSHVVSYSLFGETNETVERGGWQAIVFLSAENRREETEYRTLRSSRAFRGTSPRHVLRIVD